MLGWISELWSGFLVRFTPNDQQKRVLYICLGMLAIITLMYQWRLTRLALYPFEIIGTVFHEFGHALTCWLTGGRVHSIDINMDESGLTRFSGGLFCLIVPAGYIGSSLFGCILLFTGFERRWSKYMAMVVGVILAITCLLSGTIMTMIMSLGLAALLAAASFYEDGKYTQYLILFMGTCASTVSILNILSSTVFHTINGSDAAIFAKHCSILIPAFVYGILWAVISVFMIMVTLLLAVRYTRPTL